jgi:hypothetical protein
MKKLSLLVAALSVAFVCASTAKATDVMENLAFAGTATCGDSFCSGYGTGPITGTFSLDVTTQTIVGSWSFSGPFGTVSSSQAGSTSFLVDRFGDINPGFQESSGVVSFIQFFFPLADTTEIGALATNVNSDACLYTAPDACDPDYVITGTMQLVSTSAPEPGSAALVVIGIGILGLTLAMRKL